MENDYQQVELEVKSYHKGYEDGSESGYAEGRVFGMIEGIDYLIGFLASQKEAIIHEYTEGVPPTKEENKDADD